ncbi:chorismate-binding protein [Nonomuraea maheshkhaliensis]|uniref:chorismate-binding protein n=1 Tax=Nonomuraea maheshkhaliensis TaxID=419590 RepID=UPI0031F75B55
MSPPETPPAYEHVVPLLSRYRPGDLLLTGTSYSLLARSDRVLTGIPLDELPAIVTNCLDARSPALAAGAITIDGTHCRITLCQDPKWAGPPPMHPCVRCESFDWQVSAIPGQDGYLQAVQTARDRIAGGDRDTVVLACSLDLTGQRPLLVRDLLRHLGGGGMHTYAVPLGGEQVLLADCPELLVAKHGSTVTATSRSGLARRDLADPAEDRAIAERLLLSVEDRHEHQFLTDAVAAALRPHCQRLHVPEPTVLATPTVWHLSTPISGRLTDPAPTSLELAATLHPTPARCGTPTSQAAALITKLEAGMCVERGFYAGLIGWQDAHGDGEWAITLHGAVLDGQHHLRMYAGASIAAASDLDAVLTQTGDTFAAMLHALHYEPDTAR